MDTSLVNYMKEQLRLVSLDFRRYMYDVLPWGVRLVGLMGPRGVGKSTLVLQHIKEMNGETLEKSLYVSADHSYFTTHTLTETADQFVREGGEWLYIDEVHKYDGWSKELKQIYDSHPELHTFFTGSSVLDILDGEADLSRRPCYTTCKACLSGNIWRCFMDSRLPCELWRTFLKERWKSKDCLIPYRSSCNICERGTIRFPRKDISCKGFSK